MTSFCVHLVDNEQEAIGGSRVGLRFISLLLGSTAEEYVDADVYEEGAVGVLVGASSYGTYYCEDGDCVTITS